MWLSVCTSSKPILLGCLGGRDRKLEGSKGGFFTFKEKQRGEVTKGMRNVLEQWFPKCGPGTLRGPQEISKELPEMNHSLTFALLLHARI